MGIFGSLFGSVSDKYSQREHPITELEIRKLVTHEHVRTLSHDEQNLVENEIIRARLGDGKISMRKIYEILNRLAYAHKISMIDKKALVKLFERYYAAHFPENR